MKTLQTEICIKASATAVWKELMNFEAYSDWNPFIRFIKGTAKEGNIIQVVIHPEGQKPMTFTPIVLVRKEYKEFRWLGKLWIRGLFDGEHFFKLETVDANTTRFIHGEHFRGLLVRPLLAIMGVATRKGFEKMNIALKKKVEK